MTPERLREIEKLFHAARERPLEERDAFLADACAADLTLRREVESLLAQPSVGVIDAPSAMLGNLIDTPAPRLAPGSSIGAYRIERLLDTGGMGEVYRARDTTLGRDVAIKVLPHHFTSDPDRLARFEREARMLAALNHPHIGAIYGVVDAAGVRGLVLELIDGHTLADRLTAGPLTLSDALRTAHQIAEALEAAHAKGIIHRDLKPANITITAQGVVKVIDFGLAKAVGANAAGHEIGALPTITSGGTRSGHILGTPTYMSPEQARGADVDKRADIWAFGCVLFEMLTGRNAFEAGTAAEALAKILEREPDWTTLPRSVPETIRRLVRRCLSKDPSTRLHDIADARVEIADVLAHPETDRGRITGSWRTQQKWSIAVMAAAAIAVAILGALALWPRQSRSPGLLEFPINLTDNPAGLGLAVSPDGRRVLFATCCGGQQISVHSLDTGVTRAVVGTDGGLMPFWAPDGSSLGFFADGKLKRIDTAGGPAVIVSDAVGPAGGSWNAAGVMLYSAESRLFHVSTPAGARVPVAVSDEAGELAIRTFPAFLPDGRHFLYHLAGPRGGEVRLGTLESAVTTRLVISAYPAAFAAPSHLLFISGTALMAQALDPRTLAIVGPPSIVAPDVAPGSVYGLAHFSASPTGVLAFMKTRGGSAGQLTWFDRSGRALTSIEQPPGVEYLNPAISPDGTRVLANRMDPQTGNWDIWVVDTARNVSSRLTDDPGLDADSVWSADGTAIVFASNRGGQFGLYRRTVDGGAEELLATLGGRVTQVAPTDWSTDGRFVLFNMTTAAVPLWEVWVLPLEGDRTPSLVLRTRFFPYGARFSPDGKWIAYASTETGPYEVYVERFMAPGERIPITRGGGVHPRWTANGREIVYWSVPGGGLASVDLDLSGTSARVGVSKPLIPTSIPTLLDGRTHYDVTRDGQRFLLRQPAGPQRPAITVMVNWTEKLGRPALP